MISIDSSAIALNIRDDELKQLNVLSEQAARDALAHFWDEEREYLVNYLAVFYPKNSEAFSEQGFFITLMFVKHGYIDEESSKIDVKQVKQQFLDDFNMLNREGGWTESEKIYFERFWPKPKYDASTRRLDFGLMLRDHAKNTISKTVNRFILTRYGHLELNVSIQDKELQKNLPLEHYLAMFDEVSNAITINSPFRYNDIDYDNDTPSKSSLIHLVLSAEKF